MVNGLSIAYEVIGDGRPWVITPGGRFSKDSPGVASWPGARGGRQPGAHLGPAQHGRLRRVLHRAVRVGHAGRRAGPAVPPRHDARGHRRRLGRLPCRCSPPPAIREWPPRWPPGGSAAACTASSCSAPTTAATQSAPPGPGAWRRSPPCPSGRGAGTEPGQPAAFLDQDPQEFIATLERWMVPYCPCGDELVPGLPDADARARPGARVPQRGQRPQPRGRRPRGWRRCCRTPGSSSPPGATTSGTSARPPGPEGAGEGLFVRWPCWPPSCWPGPTMCSDHPFPTMEEPPCPRA